MIEVKGKAGIVVKMLADSVNEAGNRLSTFELTYPRIIHAELLTHGMLVRNAASSRAIPFKKMVEQMNAVPVRFGEANPGMQDKGIDHDALVLIPDYLLEAAEEFLADECGFRIPIEDLLNDAGCLEMSAVGAWKFHRFLSVGISGAMNDAKYHKQTLNRLGEAHQMMKTVLSCTAYANFDWLRNHGAADPTLEELAKCMSQAREESKPILLKPGQWHTPYVEKFYTKNDGSEFVYWIMDANNSMQVLTEEQAIKVSCARCAAVSFRNEDYGLEKCLEVYDRLIGDEQKHASAMQHCASPMKVEVSGIGIEVDEWINSPYCAGSWEPGISHMDREGNLWSAQFKGWIMWRKLIDGENYTGENK